MLLKILRTIIGLPFVLFAWVFILAITLISIPYEFVLWAITNEFDDDCIPYLMADLKLPYEFLISVWGQDNG